MGLKEFSKPKKWKDWYAWVKGGVIGFILTFILSFLIIPLCILTARGEEGIACAILMVPALFFIILSFPIGALIGAVGSRIIKEDVHILLKGLQIGLLVGSSFSILFIIYMAIISYMAGHDPLYRLSEYLLILFLIILFSGVIGVIISWLVGKIKSRSKK